MSSTLINVNADCPYDVNAAERRAAILRPVSVPPSPAPESASQGWLTAPEVAELLNVKRETVYAYVSRGVLHRVLAMDGRTSLFDKDEVEAVRRGRRPDRDGEMRTILATRLTRVSDEGLWVRGHDIVALIGDGAGFPHVVDLLWESPEDESWQRELQVRHERRQPALAGLAGQPVPPAMPLLDQLRVVVAAESASDPMRSDLSERSVRAVGRRVLGAMTTGVGSMTVDDASVSNSDSPPARRPAALLWHRLTSIEATSERVAAMDMALALLADHGLATSTFAARVAASVRADPYSVIGAGLGALGGPLHGAASKAVHRLFAAAASSGGDPAAAVGEILEPGRALPGFGHSVYETQDPRYGALMAQVVKGWADDPALTTVFRVRDVIAERSDAVANVDLALGALTYLARMSPDAGEAIFAVARTAGWLAHAMEEYTEKPLRFRPRASYLGPQAQ